VPAETTEQALWALFTPFGTVRNLHLLKGSDGKPRGCAMVLFQRWAQAEAAAESLDGAVALESGGQSKPLVVHFANPRRAPPGQPAEPGIAPRKLFVGQVRGRLVLAAASCSDPPQHGHWERPFLLLRPLSAGLPLRPSGCSQCGQLGPLTGLHMAAPARRCEVQTCERFSARLEDGVDRKCRPNSWRLPGGGVSSGG
jgi:hypothetical protein